MPDIVAIDDDELLLQLIEETLGAAGHNVKSSTDGMQGLELVRAHRPALVLLDITLPGTDGMDVLKALRAEPEVGKTPVIMLTARRTQQDVVSAVSLGVNDYIAKPFKPEDLAARVARILERSA